jgi:hypothetical protein
LLVPFLIALQSLAEGENCPAAVDVEARVRSILHLAPERELSESFLVERHEAGLFVLLRSADSTVIGERTLPTQGSCDELAQAAAVVLSAWLTDVHPDFAGELPARPVEPPAPIPPPPPPPPPVLAPPPPPPPPPPVARAAGPFDVSLGVGTQLSRDGLGPLAASLNARYGAPVQGIGVTAFGILTLARTEPLAEGEVEWRRWPFGVGPEYRISTPRVSLDISAGPALGWLRFEGHGFDRTDSQAGVTWGGFANMRLSLRTRPFAPFVLAHMQIFPFESTAWVKDPQQQPELTLPPEAFVLSVGLLFAP